MSGMLVFAPPRCKRFEPAAFPDFLGRTGAHRAPLQSCAIVFRMKTAHSISRRTFLAMAGMSPFAKSASVQTLKVPVGLELYSVRTELMRDLMGTVRAVARMGYEVVEFYAPYFDWTPEYAREVRKLLDELGIRCNSTHNNSPS